MVKEMKKTSLGLLPNDWDVDILEHRLKIQTGSRNTEDKQENGKYPFFVRSSKIEHIDTYHYDCEAILTAGDGVGTGKVFHYINGKFDAHQRVYILTEFEGIKGKYFYYYFRENFLKEVSKYTAKSSVDSVRRDMIAKMAVPIPKIEEQVAIAEALSDVDSLISSLQKLIEKKKAIKQGAMQELLTGKKRLLGFSGEWETRKVGELCSIVTKQTGFDYTSTIKPNLIEHPQSNALPMIQTKNFEGRKFDFSTDYYIPADIAKEFDKIVFDTVCLLFSIVGASVGNIGLFPGDKVAFCGGAIGIAKFYHEIDAIYSFYYFLSESGQQQIRNVTKGGAQATVTIEDIREFTIPYPNLKERTMIAQTLSDMDSEIEQQEKKLAKYQQIKQGMMQELLTGRIRLV